MAKKKTFDYKNPPEKLTDHIFFGLKLDEAQERFRDAVWDPEKQIVFVDAPAGSGKSLLAVATSVLLVRCGRYDEIVYVMHSVGDRQGFLPGTISEKSSVWFEALYQALATAGENPDRVIRGTSMTQMEAEKTGEAYVTAITDSYLRGSNIGGGEKRSILIVDEAQNFDEFSLRKVLTRACEGTKVIVIGHHGQCDLYHPDASGFRKCIRYFESKRDPRVAICSLQQNYRGFVSRTADEPWIVPERPLPKERGIEEKLPFSDLPSGCIGVVIPS